MSLRKPTPETVADQKELHRHLVASYEALRDLEKPTEPGQAPKLKAITLFTLADLRKTRGDAAGELGPRATIVGGGAETLDGREGIYVWDQTSRAVDDGVNVIQVADVDVGRWRRTGFSNPPGAPIFDLVLSADLSVPAAKSRYVSDYLEIGAGVAVEIGAEGVLEVG